MRCSARLSSCSAECWRASAQSSRQWSPTRRVSSKPDWCPARRCLNVRLYWPALVKRADLYVDSRQGGLALTRLIRRTIGVFEAQHGVAFDSPEARTIIQGELAEDDAVEDGDGSA